MLYLFRHGESLTNINLDETCAFDLTDDNTVLTNRGLIHAMNTGMTLKEQGVSPDIIFTSPLARARQTAYTLASSFEHGCPIKVIPDLREIVWHSGDVFERHETHRDISACFDTIDAAPLPGLECQRDVYDRVIPVVPDFMIPAMEGNTVFVVAHFFVVKAIRSYLDHGVPDMMPTYKVPNVDPVVYTEMALNKLDHATRPTHKRTG